MVQAQMKTEIHLNLSTTSDAETFRAPSHQQDKLGTALLWKAASCVSWNISGQTLRLIEQVRIQDLDQAEVMRFQDDSPLICSPPHSLLLLPGDCQE